ncbi:protein obstructor-E [Drosophila guanche]|uniref:Blast:Probable chitinase 3 n=1 Tax=Drosophila guanche TaxID=7266 RepID=A0A3B0JU29_DROGU|nr:protein obstructor-E [Drosophila guanche]XP_034134772.1 protein obstructor-E [Drosophila guanche]SPP85617.1 blast:Probable chitinase 3 [Drosophila guanche]
MALLKICIFALSLAVVVQTTIGQQAKYRGQFRIGAGHPPSQRHFPPRDRDPVGEAAVVPKRKQEAVEYEPSEECPEANGFYPDSKQCDKYYACLDGVPTERLCADGMVFNDYTPIEEKCDLPYNIDCSKRSKLQTPQSSQHCPRKNGYFGHEKPGICDKFYFCVDGKFNMITCPQGLVFNPKTGICTWPDEVGVTGCKSEDIFEFTCPKVNESIAVTHPRYADPDDCQFFYVCVNGDLPRRNGCKLGQVFDEDSKNCDWARKVPDCADWYKDRLTDAELDELENPKPKSTTTKRPPRVRGPSRRKPTPKVVKEEQQEEEV